MHECDVRIGYITVDMYTEHPPNYIYRIFAVCPIMSGGYLSPCEKAAHITPKAAIVRASLPPLLCPLPSANFSRVCGWCASGRRRGKEAAAEKAVRRKRIAITRAVQNSRVMGDMAAVAAPLEEVATVEEPAAPPEACQTKSRYCHRRRANSEASLWNTGRGTGQMAM